MLINDAPTVVRQSDRLAWCRCGRWLREISIATSLKKSEMVSAIAAQVSLRRHGFREGNRGPLNRQPGRGDQPGQEMGYFTKIMEAEKGKADQAAAPWD
jgi:hypothetical protein